MRDPRPPLDEEGNRTLPHPEVTVHQTSRAIEHVAARIEGAYFRRRPRWRQEGLDPRLWSAAAAVLLEAHQRNPWVPLDPELFVASQIRPDETSDPWMDLTRPLSRRRYLARVRQIVRGLRVELRQEIRRIERIVNDGATSDVVLLTPSRTITALGRYLAAIRLGRPDLAELLRAEAQEQHWSCPLYRVAAQTLAPDSSYPVSALVPDLSGSSHLAFFRMN